VIACKQPDRDALTRALAEVRLPTGGGLVDTLNVSVNGSAIVLSRFALTRHSNAEPALTRGVQYIAVYSHATEWPHYKKLFEVLDRMPSGPEGPLTPNGPPFFSGNLESLGDSLARLQRASIVSNDTGPAIHETVRYEFARPDAGNGHYE
jgi:hypothetical protein